MHCLLLHSQGQAAAGMNAHTRIPCCRSWCVSGLQRWTWSCSREFTTVLLWRATTRAPSLHRMRPSACRSTGSLGQRPRRPSFSEVRAELCLSLDACACTPRSSKPGRALYTADSCPWRAGAVVGQPTVENCLLGFNSSIFAYGQTGSGKTHTMIGDLPPAEGTSSLPPNVRSRQCSRGLVAGS